MNDNNDNLRKKSVKNNSASEESKSIKEKIDNYRAGFNSSFYGGEEVVEDQEEYTSGLDDSLSDSESIESSESNIENNTSSGTSKKGNAAQTAANIAINIAKDKAKKKLLLLAAKYVLPVVGAILVGVLAIVIVYSVAQKIVNPFTSMFSFFNEDKNNDETSEEIISNDLIDILGDDYKNMSTEEMFEYLYDNNPCDTERSIWPKIWDVLRPGVNSVCELQKNIFDVLKNRQNTLKDSDQVKISYGLITATLIDGYHYEKQFTESLDEHGESIFNSSIGEIMADPAMSSQILNDLVNNKSISKSDIETMVDNLLFEEKYSIYKYEVEEVDIYDYGILSGIAYYHKCKEIKIEDTFIDYQKYLIFLRYGEIKAEKYQEYYNLNKSFEYSDEQCKLTTDIKDSTEQIEMPILAGEPGYDPLYPDRTRTWRVEEHYMQSFVNANKKFYLHCDGNDIKMTDYVDFSELYEVADIDSDKTDVLTFSYEEGFMAQTFSIIEEESQDKKDKYFVKNLEHYIREIVDSAEEIDDTFGIYARFLSTYFDSKGGIKACYSKNYSSGGTNLGSGTCSDVDSIRITSCPVGYPTRIDPFNDQFNTFKGGVTPWITIGGYQLYKAKETISLKEYIMGVTSGEIGMYLNRSNMEAIKAFMVMAMSYALSPQQEGYNRVSREGDELYLPPDDYCFQVYYDYRYRKLGDEAESIMSEAFEEAKNYLLFWKNTDKIFMSSYVNVQQNKLVELAANNPNLTFKELLVHPEFLATAHSEKTKETCKCNTNGDGYNYEDYEVKACKGSGVDIDGLIYYSQREEPWGSANLCKSPDTLSEQGCFLTSLSMALANMKQDTSITPLTVNEHCNTYWPDNYLAEPFNMNCTTTSLSAAKAALENGNMVIVQTRSYSFTEVDHYILIAKSDGNKLYILDPYYSENNGWVSNGSPCVACSVKKGTEYTWDFISSVVKNNNYNIVEGS